MNSKLTLTDQIHNAMEQVGREGLPLQEWFNGADFAQPKRNLKPHIKRAGWPSRQVMIDGAMSLVTPATWLQRLAAMMNWPESRAIKS